MPSTTPMRYALSMAIAAALAPMLVAAQDAATPASRDDGNAAQAAGELDTIVVSGSAKFRGVRKRDASYSIRTENEDEVREAAPTSTADLLRSRNNGRDISGVPGIDATGGTLIGDDFRRVTLPIGIGIGNDICTMRRDMADGRGVDITAFGGALDCSVGRWTISDRFHALSGDAPTNALFTGANPQTLSSFITSTCGATATGTGTFVNGGGTVRRAGRC